MPIQKFAIVIIAIACSASPSAAQSQDAPAPNRLELAQSVAIALAANDPTIALFEERALALEDRAIADSQLPDPVFSTRMQSIPLSSFDINREPMTQLALGVRQSFPKGKSRALTRQKRLAEALAERHNKELRNREISLQTRQVWLELFYWKQAKRITQQTQTKVEELREVSETNYANGRGSAQNVLRVDLEVSLLATKLIGLDRQADLSRVNLSRLIGIANAARPLPDVLPTLPPFPTATEMQSNLVRHPSVKVIDAMITARDRDIDLANQQYKPGFSIDAAYGLRDSRSDFGSIGVSYSIPLFTKNRQDRSLSATRHLRSSARLARSAQLLELNRQLGRHFADWTRLDEHINLYETEVIGRATDTAEAAMLAYETEAADFAELVRAELAVLDTELALIRLQVDQTKAHAALLFLKGEKS